MWQYPIAHRLPFSFIGFSAFGPVSSSYAASQSVPSTLCAILRQCERSETWPRKVFMMSLAAVRDWAARGEWSGSTEESCCRVSKS